MNEYREANLEQLLRDVESDLVERKESLRGDAPTAVREAVCAFCNDLPNHQKPGVVFVGVKDDGTPSGCPITDELLRSLADIKTDGNIVPPPTLAVAKQTLHGSEVAVVIVEPSDSPPVRFKGRIWIRIGPRRGIASAQDERILNERRRHHDRTYDVQPVRGAALSDLDRRLFEETYLVSAIAPDVLEANERSYEQRLAATKMVATLDDPTPTVLGILVLGLSPRDFIPGAYVQFLRVAGDRPGDAIVDELVAEGNLYDTVRRVEDKLQSHNRVAVDFTSDAVERRQSLYPAAALQQIVRNALMHRTYESTNAPVRISWYDDRVEIMNPGGPFGIVSAENFGMPGVADYRNPNLAEAMRVLGLVQRFGMGIATARRELQRNGNPDVEFAVHANYVVATLRPPANARVGDDSPGAGEK